MRTNTLTGQELIKLNESFPGICRRGNIGQIQDLISQGVDVNSFNNGGHTALHYASFLKNAEVINILIANKADPNAINGDGKKTPLIYLIDIDDDAEDVDADVIDILVKAGADPSLTNNDGESPIQIAISRNNIGAVESLCKVGANLDLSNDLGLNPLHKSICSNNFAAIEILIKNGANVNYVVTSGRFKDLTMLQFVTLITNSNQELQKQIIKILFDYGADISVLNDEFFAKYPHQLYKDGNVATYDEGPNHGQNIPVSSEIKDFIASLKNSEIIARRDQELIKLNEERDANIARVTEFVVQKKAQEQALIDAINSANIAEIKRLVEKENVYVNFFNEAKQNPLLVALENKNLSEGDKQAVIQTLLSLKALPNRSLYLAVVADKPELLAKLLEVEGTDIKMTYGGEDLMQIAVEKNSPKSITKLLELGLVVDKEYGKFKINLLHLASRKGNTEVIKALIELKLDINKTDKLEFTPLYYSSLNGNSEAIKTLLFAGANLIEFNFNDNCLDHLIKALKTTTPEELAEIKQQPEKLKKIQESGVYAILKIANLQCTNLDNEQQKQDFLKRIFLKQQPDLGEIEQGDGGAPTENQTLESRLEFLTFPPILEILETNKISAENKIKIIDAIAKKTKEFKEFYANIVKITTSAKTPILNPKKTDSDDSSYSISENDRLLVTTHVLGQILSDKAPEFKVIDREILSEFIVVLLEKPSSQIERTSSATQLDQNPFLETRGV